MNLARQRLLQAGLPTILVLLFAAVGAYQKCFDLDRSDSALYAYGGFVLDAGGRLYRDIWDHKPPGAYVINALAMRLAGGPSWPAVVTADTVATLLAAAGCAALTWRISRRRVPPAIAAVVAAFYLDLAALHEGGGMAEIYMAALLAWAAFGFVAGKTSPAHHTALLMLSGALAGLAMLCKPIAGTILAATAGTILFETLHSGAIRRVLLDKLQYLAGLAVPLLVVGGLFALQGTLYEMIDAALVYNLSYLQHGDGLAKFARFHLRHNLFLLPALLVVLAAGSLLICQPRQIPLQLRQRPWLVFLPLWLVLEWLGSYAGNYDNGQYMFGCVLPLACLVGLSVPYVRPTAIARARRPAGALAVSLLLACLVLACLPVHDQCRQTWRVARRDMPEANVNQLRAGDYIRQATSSASRIWVWGYAPQVYLAARRMPATRYVFDGAFLNSG